MTIELANRLAELRKQKGLSQEELADKLQVSRQAISKWERGEASPDTDNLIELAKIYGVSLDELVGLSSDKKQEENEPQNDKITIDDDGIHIKDDEGNEVEVKEGHIHLKDENGQRVVKGVSKNQKISILVSTITTLLVVITYLLLGSLLGLWAKAWVLFLLVAIIPSIVDAILNKRLFQFSYAVFITFIYLLLNVWILSTPLWHPLWVMFITIPIYWSIASFVKHNRQKDNVVIKDNDDEDDDNDDGDND